MSERASSNTDLIDLELIPRSVLHGPSDLSVTRGRVFVSDRLLMVPLKPQELSDRLRQYGQRNSGARKFTQISFTASFVNLDGEPILNAVIEIKINAGRAVADASAVIAEVWPERLTVSETQSAKMAVKANLGVVKPEAEVTRQLEAGRPFLFATGEGTDTVQWDFTRRASHDLVGLYRLALVVDSPRGEQCFAALTVSANIRKKHAGVIGYSAAIPESHRSVRLT